MSVKIADLLKVLRAMHPEQLMADSYAGALKRAEELLCSLGLADWDKSVHRPRAVHVSPQHEGSTEQAAEPIFEDKTRPTFTGTSTCKGSWPYCRGGHVCVLDHDNKFRAVPCPVCALSQPPFSGGKSTYMGPMLVDKDVIGPEDHPAPLPEYKPGPLEARIETAILHLLSTGAPGQVASSFGHLLNRMSCSAGTLRQILNRMVAEGRIRHEGGDAGMYLLPNKEPAEGCHPDGTKPRHRPVDLIYRNDVLYHLSVPGRPLSYDELRSRMAYPKDRDGLWALLTTMVALGDVRHEGELYSLPNAAPKQDAVEKTTKELEEECTRAEKCVLVELGAGPLPLRSLASRVGMSVTATCDALTRLMLKGRVTGSAESGDYELVGKEPAPAAPEVVAVGAMGSRKVVGKCPKAARKAVLQAMQAGWLTLSSLAKETKLSRGAVLSALHELEAENLVIRDGACAERWGLRG